LTGKFDQSNDSFVSTKIMHSQRELPVGVVAKVNTSFQFIHLALIPAKRPQF
jgi:hypothetical protein